MDVILNLFVFNFKHYVLLNLLLHKSINQDLFYL